MAGLHRGGIVFFTIGRAIEEDDALSGAFQAAMRLVVLADVGAGAQAATLDEDLATFAEVLHRRLGGGVPGGDAPPRGRLLAAALLVDRDRKGRDGLTILRGVQIGRIPQVPDDDELLV